LRVLGGESRRVPSIPHFSALRFDRDVFIGIFASLRSHSMSRRQQESCRHGGSGARRTCTTSSQEFDPHDGARWNRKGELLGMRKLTLKVFVYGSVERYRHAVDVLRRVCQQSSPDAHHVEIIDVRKSPDLAEAYNVLATPTVLKTNPGPQQRLLGDFRDPDMVASWLGLHPDRETWVEYAEEGGCPR